MIAMTPHRAAAWLLGVIALATMGGCAVERSSLSIDSNSRVPFLGLQLAPPKSKEPAYQRQISRERKKSGADQPKVALAVESTKTETKWPDWLNPLPQRVSQPLPRTEPEPATPTINDDGTSATDSGIEF
jgi:hypothetical protein